MSGKTYIAIDLKSFYASVECVDRGLDPLTTNLVVADESRTEKTICLAVTPSLKACGVGGRPRLFEVVQRVREINRERCRMSPGKMLGHKSYDSKELEIHSSYALDYIIAMPRMARYMEVSSEVYEVYLKYIAPEDIHVYSIDEVFIDASSYLKTYGLTVEKLASKIILDVLKTTGITATAGIGTNLYLCKIAMDIVAKRKSADSNGVRIASLDEISYRRLMWDHRPLTDFWRVGRGIAAKLEQNGMFTMGDIARCSVDDEELLYKLFGVNAELLIDHAWGWEPAAIADIKAYRPRNTSLSTGQVLQEPYKFEDGLLVVREMADSLSFQLMEKGLAADKIVLTIGYDVENLSTPEKRVSYQGETITDFYGRSIPKYAHGTQNLPKKTTSSKMIMQMTTELYERIVSRELTIRRITIAADTVSAADVVENSKSEQLDLFTDYNEIEREERELFREEQLQRAILNVRKKYGKNALLKGVNFEDGATMIQRNQQVGGHKA